MEDLVKVETVAEDLVMLLRCTMFLIVLTGQHTVCVVFTALTGTDRDAVGPPAGAGCCSLSRSTTPLTSFRVPDL
jgi:hypothetical protein